MSWLESIDLDSTAQCPLGNVCAGCGSSAGLDGRVLDVVVTESQEGVFCLTVCDRCSPEGWQLPLPWVNRRVLEHCEHLGISTLTMTEKMKHEGPAR